MFLRNIIILILFASLKLFSQNCDINDYVFTKNEKITYTVYYNWGVIWIKSGTVSFEVKDTVINNKAIWRFISIGKTLPSYNWIFEVNDYFTSWVLKKGFKPLYHYRNTKEGDNITNNTYIFSLKKNKIYTKLYNSEKGKRTDTLDRKDCLFDVLSATYYTRSIDFSGLKSGKTFVVNTIMDGEIEPITIKYYGTETITHKNGNKYTCYHFSTEVIEGNVFKAGEKIHVWVNKDKNRVPILIKADILVGSVKVFLNKAENLKY